MFKYKLSLFPHHMALEAPKRLLSFFYLTTAVILQN